VPAIGLQLPFTVSKPAPHHPQAEKQNFH